jgi:Putative zinc-finger
MNRMFNLCNVHRENLCLLAAGALPRQEHAGVESHLATCAGCRKYYDEIKSVTRPLGNWEKNFDNIEPIQAMQERWAKDFAAAIETDRPARMTLLRLFFDWCKDMIWPCRRVWAGLAVVWVAIVAINFHGREASQSMALKSSQPSPELVRAFLESEGFLSRLTEPDENHAARPPKPPLPQTRSERRSRIFRA